MRYLIAAALLATASPALAQMADTETLNDRLVGNTFQGDMGSAGYASYFAEDGTYYDEAGSGTYEITEDGVCYPDSDFGCYQASIQGDILSWSQGGEDMGSGEILEGDALGLMEQ